MASYAIGDYLEGSASSLKKYETVVAAEFEEYLSTRADYYGRERRWPHSPFWQRRHGSVTLDPAEMLRAGNAARASAAVEKLSMHLPVPDLKLLCRLCEAPRQAQEVVSQFKTLRSFNADRRIILALQYLVEEGIIEAAAT